VAFFPGAGTRVQISGGPPRLALPDSGPDPTDAAVAREPFRARRREVMPERRLVLAVFTATLEDLARRPPDAKDYATAWRWLMSNDERWPLAFRPVCDVLELDADAVRARLRATIARRAPVLPVPPVRELRAYRAPRDRPPVLLCRATG
jgi:hypothetical protein